MSKQCESGRVSRRTVLLGAAGALPLVALGATGAQAAKLSMAEGAQVEGGRVGAAVGRIAEG